MKTKTEINLEYRVGWVMYPTAIDGASHTQLFTTRKAATKFFNRMKQHHNEVTLYKITIELLAGTDD